MSILVGASQGLSVAYFVALNVVGEVISLALYLKVDLEAEDVPKVIPDFSFGSKYCKNPDGSVVLALHDLISVDKDDLPPSMNLRRIEVLNNIYVAINENNRFKLPYNKHAETYQTKDNGIQHIIRANHNVVAQFGMPFIDSPLADCSIRITYDASLGYWCNVPVESVANTHQGYIDFGAQRIPSLSTNITTTTIGVDADGSFDLRLIDGVGNPISRRVRVFIESTGGYLPLKEVYTDDTGKITVRFKTLGLSLGDEFEISAGFKWFSGIAKVRVQVV